MWRPGRVRQIWDAGKDVKVGFLTLGILKKIAPPGDGMPGKYLLIDHKTKALYYFTPYYGLAKI